jgi:O-antigen/teichoic acid export membrane protein
MASEFKRSFVRIAANYARLLSTLVLGLLVVPILLGGLGVDGFGIISLLGSTVGLAAFFRELTHRSMVRELGSAYHDSAPLAFDKAFNSACILAAGVSAITVCAFLVLLTIFPYLKIPDHLRDSAFWFLIAQGCTAAYTVLISPVYNMYVVKERFIAFNIAYTLQRSSNIISISTLIFLVGINDPAKLLLLHGILWSCLDITFQTAAALLIIASDHRLIPRRSLMSREGLRPIAGTFGWNTGVYASFSLHERVPPLILNLAFGLAANAVWGVAFRFVSYVRMATFGMQFGADMVSARLSASNDEAARRAVRDLLFVQTRLNALAALPVGLLMLVLTEPMLGLWVGKRLEEHGDVFAQAVLTTRILAIAVITRAISEAWMTVLYGAGHVRRYAPIVMLGGILNPITALILITVLPTPQSLYGPAIAFTGILSLVNMIALPIIAARVFHVGAWRVVLPMWRPAVVTIAASPVLAGYWLINWPHVAVALIVVVGVFGTVFAGLTWAIVLTAGERARFTRFFHRVARRKPEPDQSVSVESNTNSTNTEA